LPSDKPNDSAALRRRNSPARVAANNATSSANNSYNSNNNNSSGGGGGGKSLLPDRWFETLSQRLGPRAALVAPELHARGPVEFSDRADVWSLGLVLHELLTQRVPYSAEGVMWYEVAKLVQSGAPPARVDNLPRLKEPSLQPALRILDRCLASSPLERPSASRLCTYVFGVVWFGWL
jgi:serine/threonine protein kinase